MKTDPPAPHSSKPAHHMPHHRGKVFDIMRPGRAPAPPTSRPVVIGDKLAAQAAQMRVSGIGAPPLAPVDARVAPVVPQPHAVPATPPASASPEAAPSSSAQPATTPSLAPELDTSSVHGALSASAPTTAAPESFHDPASPAPGDGLSEAGLAEAALEPEPLLPPAAAEPEQPLSPVAAHSEHDPVLHDAAAPSLEGQVVVSHHTTAPAGTWKLYALVTLVLLFAFLVLDILLDVGVLSLPFIPHTNLF